MFGSRFFIQWIASERAGESVVPMLFWYLSIAGSLALLAYALHLRDPVSTLAFLPNCFVYLPNIPPIRRKRKAAGGAGPWLVGDRRDADGARRRFAA